MNELELLDRVLASTSFASDIFFAGAPCGEWRMGNAGAAGEGATFHLVLQGTAWLHGAEASIASRELAAGDFVFLPRDSLHSLTHSAARPPACDIAIAVVHSAAEATDQAVVLCGKLLLEPETQRFLLAPLPDVLVIRTGAGELPSIVPSVIALLWNEVRSDPKPLTATLNRLADVLIVQVLQFAVRQRIATSGLFAGLVEPQLRRAIAAVVEAPERPWTVDSLAERAAMSRSAFAARFLSVVGASPLHFIREWRMARARTLLRQGRSVAAVAAAVGYDSEVAFAKTFKRVTGIGPGAMRRG